MLIVTVGVLNGAGWALCQNWKWAPQVWPGANFNWWRCWESSGGISIGIAYGVAYFLVNRRMSEAERAVVRSRRSIAGPNLEWLAVFLGLASLLGFVVLREVHVWSLAYIWHGDGVCRGVLPNASPRLRRPGPVRRCEAYGDPNIERFGLYLGLLIGLGFSLRNGLKGWFNIYYGNEDYWGPLLWQIIGPAILAAPDGPLRVGLASAAAQGFPGRRIPARCSV